MGWEHSPSVRRMHLLGDESGHLWYFARMEKMHNERPALLVIDMVKDNFATDRPLPITQHALKIIAPINDLIASFRSHDWPVVFSTDAFQESDFIFKSRMPLHSLAGTEGADVIDELSRTEEDLWLPKPRFSAFFNTSLASTLKDQQVTLCAVAGIATNFCVLTTCLDAVCNDFKAVLLSDCSAAMHRQLHDNVIATYERNPLQPLFEVARSRELIQALGA
jgi:nicotinamidase/pyrazinamidase